MEYVPYSGRRGHKPYSPSKFWAVRLKYRPNYMRSRKVFLGGEVGVFVDVCVCAGARWVGVSFF
jgi:hypothetical protein